MKHESFCNAYSPKAQLAHVILLALPDMKRLLVSMYSSVATFAQNLQV